MHACMHALSLSLSLSLSHTHTHTHSLFTITHNKYTNSSTPKNKPRSSYKYRVANAVLARYGT